MSARTLVANFLGSRTRVASLGVLLTLSVAGCHRTVAQDSGANNVADPADANLAPVDAAGTVPGTGVAQPRPQVTRVLAQSSVNEAQQQAEDYGPQGGAPSQNPAANAQYGAQLVGGQGYPNQGYPAQGYPAQSDPNQGYPGQSDNQYSGDPEADAYAADLTQEAATDPPPPLPEYEQPPCPDPDYIWTPGYWAWGPSGYYWVPGVWVAAPYAGALWTPGYWAFVTGAYRFHHGFWGTHIGFYGGIDYGYGYTGYGYYGGYWRGGHFFYNTSVNRVNVNAVRNVYSRNVMINNVVVNNRMLNRVSYNGGRGGLQVRPRPAELAVLREQRMPPMQSQLAIRRDAEGNRAQFFTQNHGRPQIMAASRPVAADRTLPSPLPRAATSGAMLRNGGRQENRQGAYPQSGPAGQQRGFVGPGPASGGRQNGTEAQPGSRGFAPVGGANSPRAVEPQRVVPPIQPGNVQRAPAGQAPPETRQPYYGQNGADRLIYNRQNQPGTTQRGFEDGRRVNSSPNAAAPLPQPQGQQPRPGYDRSTQPNYRGGGAPQVRPDGQRGEVPGRLDQTPHVQQPAQPQQRVQSQGQPRFQDRAQPQFQQHGAPQGRPAPQQQAHPAPPPPRNDAGREGRDAR